jgi:hypothetical protein
VKLTFPSISSTCSGLSLRIRGTGFSLPIVDC